MGDQTGQSGCPLWQVERWNCSILKLERAENNYFFGTHWEKSNLLCWNTLCYVRTQKPINYGSYRGQKSPVWVARLWIRLLREAVESPSVDHPQATRSDFGVSPAWGGSFTAWPPEVTSKLNYSVSWWFCVVRVSYQVVRRDWFSFVELIEKQMGASKRLSGQGWGSWIPVRGQVSSEQVE